MTDTPDRLRRDLLIAMGVLPAAAMVTGCQTTAASWTVENRVSITDDGTYRYIRSNGIPDHETGPFPSRRNPHTISEQKHEFRVRLNPARGGRIQKLGMHPFGVAMNGIPLDPLAAEWWNRDRSSGWQYEAMSGKIDLGLDQHNAHVQPGGAYHYHGLPVGLIQRWSPETHSALIGYAADGFPIYALYGYDGDETGPVRAIKSSYRLRRGRRPDGPGGAYDGTFVQDYEYVTGLGDLDAHNGRRTVTPDYPDGTYAYFLTNDFPFIPRSFAGLPDRSFLKGPDGQGSRPPGKRPRRHGPGHPPPPRKDY